MFSVAHFRNGPKAAAAAPWGEDLVDQSLSDWWYPATWDTVAADELVVLNPSLAAQPLCTGQGAEPFLRRVIAQRLQYSVRAFSGSASEFSSRAIRAANLGASVHVAGPVDASTGADEPYFRWLSKSQSRSREAAGLDAQAFELAAIRSIALLWEAASASDHAQSDDIDLSYGLVGSLHSGLNAAYVCPSLASAHELLAVGTWLGHLLRGRPALMPLFIAEACVDWLSASAAADQCGAIVQAHAEIAVGRHELLKAARRVLSKGHAVKVMPRRSTADIAPVVWDEPLFSSFV